jgi:anti-sigma factor ChrR (cupin superfamily)
MKINADFTQKVLIHSAQQEWVETRMNGVDRRMLDRIGAEAGHATSIVRYASGSHFSPHVHSGGEEFLVLEGVFQDEHGDYPAGTYVRNPPQSKHTPGSDKGCVIFVKLWQFDANDRTQISIPRTKQVFLNDVSRQGVEIAKLHEDQRETVSIERWSPYTKVDLVLPQGAEALLLSGSISLYTDSPDLSNPDVTSSDTNSPDANFETLQNQSWLRLPPNSRLIAKSGKEGATLWIKTRHLSYLLQK